MRFWLKAAFLTCLFSPSVAQAKPRESFEVFRQHYYAKVYSALSKIYSHGMTRNSGFLILGLTAPDRDHYVQCIFYDGGHKTGLYCEAASGYYSNRQISFSKKETEAIKREGFDMTSKAGNFSRDTSFYGEASIKKTADLMLRTLYFGYGATVGRVEFKAPYLTRRETLVLP